MKEALCRYEEFRPNAKFALSWRKSSEGFAKLAGTTMG
jgi:hypothetical protein